MQEDIINVKITDSGLVKLETDKVSMPNHLSAEKLVKGISMAAGGKTSRKSKHKHGSASHTHSHEEGEHHSH